MISPDMAKQLFNKKIKKKLKKLMLLCDIVEEATHKAIIIVIDDVQNSSCGCLRW